MRPPHLCIVVALIALAVPAAFAKSPGRSLHRDGNKTLAQLFGAELAAARAKRQGVVIMFSADWCTPCKVIKEFLEESPVAQKLVRKGRILYIDVDEWRGPAHRLIPGVVPRKLPTIVRVDDSGKELLRCYGTDLGLLSAEAVGKNLARLIAGKAPKKPAYESNPEQKMALIRAEALRQKAKHKGVPGVEIEVVSVNQETWTLRIVLRNQQAPRRWFALPQRLGDPLATAPGVTSWDVMKFNTHVRAQFIRFAGQFPFTAIPVAGNGFVELGTFELQGPQSGGVLEIWELNRLTIAGTNLTFDKKLPYELRLPDSRAGVLQSSKATGAVKLWVKTHHRVPIDP